ncbi:MAG: hypothetical protein HKP61_19055 [Dactylosporangium sp.]|nr:hypothetical protein [Dactylosporangium sp.]NNJ62988.1 hypothetical protein [Dactylosporangium sp.]
MPLYYRGPDAFITHEAFEVLTPYPQRFNVQDLRELRVVRHSLDRTVTASIHTATGALIIVALSWSLLNSVEAWLLAVLLVATPSAVGGACMRIRPRAQELRAVYHNHDVLLYSSDDARVFGQVQRALVRAREGHSSGRS